MPYDNKPFKAPAKKECQDTKGKDTPVSLAAFAQRLDALEKALEEIRGILEEDEGTNQFKCYDAYVEMYFVKAHVKEFMELLRNNATLECKE